MKRGVITLLTVTGSLAFAAGAFALTTENPYNPIVERNVFGLKPPPPPVDPTAEAAAKQPPPNVFLTGITTIFGPKRALLLLKASAAPAAKPGAAAAEKPTDESFMLAEGQKSGEVEVMEINEKAGTVKIRLAGREMTLDFDTNGIKSPPPGSGAGGLPGPGGPGMVMPGFTRPSVAPTPFGGTVTPTGTSFPGGGMNPTMPSRTLRLPGATGAGASMGAAPVTTAAASGVSFGNLTGVSPGQPDLQRPAPTMSPEQQEAFTELQREAYRQQRNPIADLLPPTRASLSSVPQPQPSGDSQNTVQQPTPTVPMPPFPGRPLPPMPGL